MYLKNFKGFKGSTGPTGPIGFTGSTSLEEVVSFDSNKQIDKNGWLHEYAMCHSIDSKIPEHIKFIQDVEIYSNKGVLRGFNFQENEFAQNKIIRCVQGIVQFVIVDLRKHSENFGKCTSHILESEDLLQFFVPRNFGVAFLTISDESIVSTKVDKKFNEFTTYGIKWNDLHLNVKWKFKPNLIKVNEHDQNWPTFAEWQHESDNDNI